MESTRPKFNMEPENDGFSKFGISKLPAPDFQLCGGYVGGLYIVNHKEDPY